MSNGKLIKLDEVVLAAFDNTTDQYYPLTDREAAILQAFIPFIEWETRWNLDTLTKDDLSDISSEIAYNLMTPLTENIANCTDVEDCLGTSTTISTIQTDVTNNTTAAGNAQSAADQAQQTADDNTEAIEEQQESSATNEYPDPPTSSEPDVLCAVAWFVARELEAVIQDLIAGTLYANILQFVNYYLTQGGWKYTSLVELWNLWSAITNPNLSTEVNDAIEHVAEAFYCNELDRVAALVDINADTNITTDAKAMYDAVIEAWTESKFALATATGRENSGEDCSTFCPAPFGVVTFDPGGYTGYSIWTGSVVGGIGNPDNALQAQGTTATCGIEIVMPEVVEVVQIVYDSWGQFSTIGAYWYLYDEFDVLIDSGATLPSQTPNDWRTNGMFPTRYTNVKKIGLEISNTSGSPIETRLDNINVLYNPVP